jgi:N-dimethylarginine dimethylaminohydrolase
MSEKKPLIRPKQATSRPLTKPDPNVQLDNPSQSDVPAFLMNRPFSWDCDSPNNVWMQKMSSEEMKPDFQLADKQWLDLYQLLASQGYVETLPAHPSKDFQDLVYVANCGIMLCHLPKPVFVAANFKSPPRKGEEKIAIDHFKLWDYRIERPSTTFEGFADLKPLRDNLYVGGYGIRTDLKTYDWFEREFEMKIIRVRMFDEWCYHFDCCLAALTPETVIACPAIMDKEDVKAIEKVVEIIPVSKRLAHAATTNIVRIGQYIVYGQTLTGLTPKDDDWQDECDKRAFFEKVLPKYGMEPFAWNGSEFEKSGAAASCCVLPINYASFATPIT